MGERTFLRIIRKASETEILVTGLTSLDGLTWDEAGAWTMPLGTPLNLGLVSMGGAGFEATFDSVTVRPNQEIEIEPTPTPTPTPAPEQATPDGGGAEDDLAATGVSVVPTVLLMSALFVSAFAVRRRVRTRQAK